AGRAVRHITDRPADEQDVLSAAAVVEAVSRGGLTGPGEGWAIGQDRLEILAGVTAQNVQPAALAVAARVGIPASHLAHGLFVAIAVVDVPLFQVAHLVALLRGSPATLGRAGHAHVLAKQAGIRQKRDKNTRKTARTVFLDAREGPVVTL